MLKEIIKVGVGAVVAVTVSTYVRNLIDENYPKMYNASKFEQALTAFGAGVLISSTGILAAGIAIGQVELIQDTIAGLKS